MVLSLLSGLATTINTYAAPGPQTTKSAAYNVTQCSQLKGQLHPFFLIIKRGDDIMESIVRCANNAELPAASVSGIGALENPTLAFYDLDQKKYFTREFDGIYELTSLLGNIAMNNGKRFLHAHVTISGHDYKAYAGHLMKSKVGVTAEIMINPQPQTMLRLPNDEIGLSLISTNPH